MTSLAERMPVAIKRTRQVRDQFIACRGMPNVIVEPQIALLDAGIDAAITALASGDAVAMLHAYAAIKDYQP